ncbi:unnamed protein product [Brassicogethes aeneus]|uniref:Uncharacterized protein n=1 Tax=Brassicogethes aeneus TaxID=1431903 RepID=A0A9P0BDY9_BRAAE|nr:unnamed protein product [Brassicogethes aeneus]
MKLKVIQPACAAFFVITLVSCVMADDKRTIDVLGKIKSGFQMAGKLLGLEQAKGVANLVSQAFGKNNRKDEKGNNGGNVFSGFLRVLGFDAKRISAIAINAIIFVAQMISSSLKLTSPSELTQARYSPGTPFDWLLGNSRVANLLTYTNDKNLPNQVIEYLKENSLDEETGCLQLLVCKGSPFIWNMQKALKNSGNETVPKGPKAMFAHLPSIEEVADYGDRCERRHPYCKFDVL